MMITSSDKNIAESTGTAAPQVDIRHLSEEQLASLGMAEVAYIKAVVMNGVPAFAIHAADGTPMAMATDEEVAVAAIRQQGLEPTRVH